MRQTMKKLEKTKAPKIGMIKKLPSLPNKKINMGGGPFVGRSTTG